MKMRIPKNQFLNQLPATLRAQVVSCNDLPDYFVFDAIEDTSEKERELRKKEGVDHVGLMSSFPDVEKVLTGMEWYMFCVMLKHPEGASVDQLAVKLKNPDVNTRNTVSVHIKCLRRKLLRHRLAFSIYTKRTNVLSSGFYKMTRKP